MDPFTITATCVGLIAAIAQLSAQINTFAVHVKEARKDMQDVLTELSALSSNLEQMRDDQSMKQYPVALRQNLLDALKSCDNVTKEMGDIVRKLSSSKIFGRFQWSLSKRDKLVSLKTKLEGHKSTITMALLVASMFLTVEVRSNTTRILDDTAAIRLETAQIPAQITTLYQCMGSLQLHIKDLQYRGDSATGSMFQNMVDNTTAYTASILNPSASNATPGRRSSDDFFDAQESFPPQFPRNVTLRVAIDFGMSYTAVCWSDGDANPNHTSLNIISKWPGANNTFHSKVPCLLAYKEGRLVSWGFLVEDVEDDYGVEIHDNFKSSLSQDDLASLGPQHPKRTFPKGFNIARQLCFDFFQALLTHIGSTLKSLCPSSKEGGVEFIISIPPSWEANTTDHFQTLVKDAGFNFINERPCQIVLLTEAEAVFAHALQEARDKFTERNIVLLIDLGGRTIKLTTLLVHIQGQSQCSKMQQIHSITHEHAGSMLIDDDFQRLVKKRLAPIEEQLAQNGHAIEDLARKMTKGRFQLFKTAFSKDATHFETEGFRIPVPGLGKDFDHQDAKVKRGCLELTSREMCQLFDNQIRGILPLVDKHLDDVCSKLPESHLTHILVSGGFANSSYVIEKLRQTYQHNSRHPFIQRLDELMIFREPELAVAKGMLQYQISQTMTGAASSVSARITRMSYGIVRNKLYNPHIHRNQDIFRDEVDGQVYARNQIHWLVKKRFNIDRLNNNQLELPLVHRVPVGKPIQPWKHTLVMGSGSADTSPTFLGHRDVGVLAEIICDDDMISEISSKTSFEKYEEIHYSVALLFKPSSIGFEVRMDGTTYGSVTVDMRAD